MNARRAHSLLVTVPLALGCSAAPAPPGSVPTAGEPPAGEEDRCIVQATYEAGDLPSVPGLHGGVAGNRLPHRAPPSSDGADIAPKAPTTGLVLEGDRLGHDPGVVASERHLMVLTAHAYRLYDKATGALLSPEPDDEIPVSGDFNTLFAPLWAPRDKRGAPNGANINRRLRFQPGDPLACDPDDPLGRASPACIREFYDSRAFWDPSRRRFWIESAVRNHLWFCTPSKTEPCTDPKWSRTQPRRFIAVAVSRTEDPRKGWHRYVLVDEYSDWPKMAIHEKYLVIAHMTSPYVYVYDADRLAAGNPDHGPVRVARLDLSSFPGARFLNPVTHHGPTGDVTYLMGTDGSDALTLFGLWNPDPTRAAAPVVLAGPRLRLGHDMGPFLNNGVYRDGKIHLAWDECVPGQSGCPHRIRVLRVPVQRASGKQALQASKDPAQGFLDATFGGRETTDDPGDVFDYVKPAMDVARGGDMVIAYARRSFFTAIPRPVPFELRYSLWYQGDAAPRPSILVRRGTWAEAPDIDDNGKAGIDLTGAQTDPGDDRTVWFTHAVADRSLSWFRQVTASARP